MLKGKYQQDFTLSSFNNETDSQVQLMQSSKREVISQVMPSENLKLKDISNKFTQESKINNDPAMDEFVKLET